MPDHSATLQISDLYKRPLQVSRYLRQFPSPRSPNSSLLRQACLNSPHTSLRTGLWQVSRYLPQFPSPRSPSMSLFSQARRNCSHCPPRPSPTSAVVVVVGFLSTMVHFFVSLRCGPSCWVRSIAL